jgi:hypothetical protein
VASCPLWCTARGDDDHEDQTVHAAAVWRVGSTEPRSLFTELYLDEALKGIEPTVVQIIEGDQMLLALSPAEARSLAAGLLFQADLAERPAVPRG